MKTKPSKLDPHADRLTEWFLAGKSLKEAQEQLRLDGCVVSLGRLSQWWESRQTKAAEDRFLEQITSGAQQNKRIDEALKENPAPMMQQIMARLKVVTAMLATQATGNPEAMKQLDLLLTHLVAFHREEGKDKDRALAWQRFMRETCELFLKWFADEQAKAIAAGSESNSSKIERLGSLMFGEDWNSEGAKTQS